MADTFENLWKRLLVYAPECPIPLAQEWVNTAYSRALTSHDWSGLRGEAEFVIPAAYTTGTASVTQNLATVTGSGTTWTSAMIGRQFYVGGVGPYYTVIAVGSTTSLTLDRTYGGDTNAAATYAITLIYLSPASDFLSFQVVLDRSNNWRLHTSFRQEQIDTWDSKRSVTGFPTLLAAAPFSTSGLPRYEIWPRIESGRTFSYRYIKKLALLSAASDTPIYPISGYALREGALSELAKWPGLKGENPFFSEIAFRMREASFQEELQRLILEDQRINQTAIMYPGWDDLPYAPIDSAYMQTHDVFV